MAQDPWEEAVNQIQKATAQSRFTKTPITINEDIGHAIARVLSTKDNKVTLKGQASDKEGTGTYDPRSKTISINLSGNPTYLDLQNSIHHEDIHALLSGSGYNKLSDMPEPQGKWSDVFTNSNPLTKAQDSWNMSGRSGNRLFELPAYLGAYSPQQLKNLTSQDRLDWMNRFLANLPPAVALKLKRIMASNDAAMTLLGTKK